MKKSMLFVIVMISIVLGACGGSDDETSNTSVDNINNDMSDGENNLDDGTNESEPVENEFALEDASLDISESIIEAYDFFDKLSFSDTEVIDKDIALKGADVTVYVDDPSTPNMATLIAHTIEPQNSFTLSVNITPDDFENKLTETDADGNKRAVEVTDGAYEYTDKLIWKTDDLVYQLDGGRKVISTVEENEIHPEEDRLLFYENLVPTNKELETYDEFYQNIKMPTRLPEGSTLYRVVIYYDQPQGLSERPPASLIYETMGQNNETILFNVYGEYEEAPKLTGDNIKEETILNTTVQIEEEKLLFTLDDETYELHYMDTPEEVMLEIAESIIEQAE